MKNKSSYLAVILPVLLSALKRSKGSKARGDTVLPQFGDMTKAQFLQWINPQDKYHPSDAYPTDLETINNPFNRVYMSQMGSYSNWNWRGNTQVSIYADDDNPDILYVVESIGDNHRKPRHHIHFILADGIGYYDNRNVYNHYVVPRKFRTLARAGNLAYRDYSNRDHLVNIPIKEFKEVKYLDDFAKRNILDLPSWWMRQYPYKYKKFRINNEKYTIRSENKPEPYKGNSLVLFNSNMEKIGAAQDEWGTTLITIVEEYRGKGLAKILFKEWFSLNPNYGSGGFTDSGYNLSLAVWADRVRELEQTGYYKEFEDKDKAHQILQQVEALQGKSSVFKGRYGERYLGGVTPQIEEISKNPKEGKDLEKIYLYLASDISFVVYTGSYFKTKSEDDIIGYVFFSEDDRHGDYIYQIDYNPEWASLITLVALQFAKSLNYKVYYGDREVNRFFDLMELDGINKVYPGALKKEGDYIGLQYDLFDLRDLALRERKRVREVIGTDKNAIWEFNNELLEKAVSKWVEYNTRKGKAFR